MKRVLVFLVVTACTPQPAQPEERFGDNPGNLVMLRHIPPDAPEPMPLVMVLHGCTQRGLDFAEKSGWRQLSDDGKFALVIAEQKPENNAQRCFNWFNRDDFTRGSGEAESLREMIEHMKTLVSVDSTRVFVTGLSAGGAMTAVMLATYPEVFAAGGIMSGVAYGCAGTVIQALDCNGQGRDLDGHAWGELVRNASSHTGPWPRVVIWQGDSDATVDKENAVDLVLQWTDVHGVPSTPAGESVTGHDHAQFFGPVESHLIEGMGHGIAVDPAHGCGTADAYFLDENVCAARRTAAFFGLVDP